MLLNDYSIRKANLDNPDDVATWLRLSLLAAERLMVHDATAPSWSAEYGIGKVMRLIHLSQFKPFIIFQNENPAAIAGISTQLSLYPFVTIEPALKYEEKLNELFNVFGKFLKSTGFTHFYFEAYSTRPFRNKPSGKMVRTFGEFLIKKHVMIP